MTRPQDIKATKKGVKIRKWIRWFLGITVFLILLLGGIFLAFFNEPVPEGTSPAQADELARKMLNALDHQAYKETRYLEWTYRGGRNSYWWDKATGVVKMTWGSFSGEIDLVSPEKSVIKEEGQVLKGNRLDELTAEAISNFNNDSFWLVAPFKIFDQGTRRRLVETENGRDGILVTYTEGGDTPGDTYLWELNEHYMPVRFRMWVEILPLKGLSATWEGWHRTESGVFLPRYHRVGPVKLDLGEVQARK